MLNLPNCLITTRRRTNTSRRTLVDYLGPTRARYQINNPQVVAPDDVVVTVSLFLDPGTDVQENDEVTITALDGGFVRVQGVVAWTAHQVLPSPGNLAVTRVDLAGSEVQ